MNLLTDFCTHQIKIQTIEPREEEDAPSVNEVGSLSRRDRTQRPKTASNTSASGGRNNRRVSIMEKKESKGSGQHSTDSSGLSSISSV